MITATTRIVKRTFCLCFLILFIFVVSPISGHADVGPKPTLKIIAQNMPDTTCYLDLLVQSSPVNVHQNIRETESYDPQLFKTLKEYHVDGWRPAMVTGTMPPLFGDIKCDISDDGNCVLNFRYMGVPDRFKIIVVSADGQIKISNEIERQAFNSTVYFDYQTGVASEESLLWAYLLQFLITGSFTVLLEGFILVLFRFSLSQNWKPFLAINLLTQILLTVVVFTVMFKSGTLLAILLYVLFEVIILVVEAILFVKYLCQHSKKRRVAYAVIANILSFLFGIYLMMQSAL